MDVTQAAGAAFHVRLQVIAGAVIALMTDVLLFHLGGEELFRWPEAVAKNMFLQFKEQRDVADQQARFNQVSGDGEIRKSFEQTLFEGAHAVAHLQLDVPQQRQQFADLLRLVVRQFFAAEDQQVDVRERVQLAAAIAADGHQRQIADGFKTVGDPQPLQQLVDKFGARRNELLRGDAGVKRLAQPVLEGIDVRLNCSTVQIALRPAHRMFRRDGQKRGGCVR